MRVTCSAELQLYGIVPNLGSLLPELRYVCCGSSGADTGTRARAHTHTHSFSEECQIDKKEFLSLLEGEIRFAMHGFVTLLIRGLGFHL